MKKFHHLVLGGLGILLVLSSGCLLSSTFKGPEILGGQEISARTLNLGHDTYMQYCMQCHGVNGDGKGPAAYGANPPPRNFQQGLYKFASVTSGELPTDKDLKHTIRFGLRGTPMLPWDISDERLDAVTHYIKTFPDKIATKETPNPWRGDGKAGTPQAVTVDPWGIEKASEAIALGKKIYHGMAQCYTCHPAYVGFDEVNAATKELTGNEISELRADAHLSINQDSSYGHKFMPPDFTKNAIKSGGDIPSLYKILGAGVGGTTMPAWKGNLSTLEDEVAKEAESEKRLWALAYYVNSLHRLKFDLGARKSFFDELNAKRQTGNRKTAQLGR
jgi:mono/diheme cytochrome c family protein